MITSGFVSIGCGPARNEGLTHEFSRTRRTTDDLLKSQEALFGGKLLTPTSLTKMTTPFRNGYGCALHLAVSASGRHVFANEGRVPRLERRPPVLLRGQARHRRPGQPRHPGRCIDRSRLGARGARSAVAASCLSRHPLKEVELDHTRPLLNLWPIDEYATRLFGEHNNLKNHRPGAEVSAGARHALRRDHDPPSAPTHVRRPRIRRATDERNGSKNAAGDLRDDHGNRAAVSGDVQITKELPRVATCAITSGFVSISCGPARNEGLTPLKSSQSLPRKSSQRAQLAKKGVGPQHLPITLVIVVPPFS